MGNNITCCRRGWNSIDDCDYAFPLYPLNDINRSVSTTHLLNESLTQSIQHSQSARDLTFIQHISEREPESVDIDPSLNVRILPGFISLASSQQKKDHGFNLETRKWSSCGNVFISHNSVTRPDLIVTLKCISYAVAIFLQKFNSIKKTFYGDLYFLYDERKHPIKFSSRASRYEMESTTISTSLDKYRQNQKLIYQFLRQIFQNAHLTPECAIVALILFERLITSCELAVLSWTWRRQFFICIIISSKILDDQAIWNADYCQILKNVSVDDLNSLERHTLQLLQFNINVDRSIYVKYYFDLMALGKYLQFENGLANRKLLDANQAFNIHLIKSRQRNENHLEKGCIFDISYPYITRQTRRLARKYYCDLDITVVRNGQTSVKLDENFIYSIKAEKKRKSLLNELQEIQAEQVASISSTSHPSSKSTQALTKKHHLNSSFDGDVAISTSRPVASQNEEHSEKIEDDYEHFIKLKSAPQTEVVDDPDWLDAGVEFF